MNHERHRCNDDKHHYADWCQTESYIKGKELSEPEPCEVEYRHRRVHTLTTVEATIDDVECLLHCLILSCIEEVVVSRVQAKAKEHRQNAGADDTGNASLGIFIPNNPSSRKLRKGEEVSKMRNQTYSFLFYHFMFSILFT